MKIIVLLLGERGGGLGRGGGGAWGRCVCVRTVRQWSCREGGEGRGSPVNEWGKKIRRDTTTRDTGQESHRVAAPPPFFLHLPTPPPHISLLPPNPLMHEFLTNIHEL